MLYNCMHVCVCVFQLLQMEKHLSRNRNDNAFIFVMQNIPLYILTYYTNILHIVGIS